MKATDMNDRLEKSEEKKHLHAVILARFEKLEKIKGYISLKTYDWISDKLKLEKLFLESKAIEKEMQTAQENLPQALPKIFFELKSLKPKNIRIN